MKIFPQNQRRNVRDIKNDHATKVFLVVNNNLQNINTKSVDLVINLNLPRETFYFQRAGRTGRGFSRGKVISFVMEK